MKITKKEGYIDLGDDNIRTSRKTIRTLDYFSLYAMLSPDFETTNLKKSKK